MLGAALVFGAVSALVRERHPGALWLDLRWLGAFDACLVLMVLGAALLVPLFARRASVVGAFGAAIVGCHSLVDAARCLPVTGWLSFSFVLFAVSLVLGVALFRPAVPGPKAWWVWALAGAAAMTLAIPLSQIAGAARADYTRPAEVAVILGARVYASGTPSLALHDRVVTGCELYRRGLVKKLVMSGGPGDGDVHETQAMKRLAMEHGVPEEDIVLDDRGLSTADTARNVAELMSGTGKAPRVIVVSHDYHLARVRLALDHEGVAALTVPARETRFLPKRPYFVLREVAGFWAYYLFSRA